MLEDSNKVNITMESIESSNIDMNIDPVNAEKIKYIKIPEQSIYLVYDRHLSADRMVLAQYSKPDGNPRVFDLIKVPINLSYIKNEDRIRLGVAEKTLCGHYNSWVDYDRQYVNIALKDCINGNFHFDEHHHIKQHLKKITTLLCKSLQDDDIYCLMNKGEVKLPDGYGIITTKEKKDPIGSMSEIIFRKDDDLETIIIDNVKTFNEKYELEENNVILEYIIEKKDHKKTPPHKAYCVCKVDSPVIKRDDKIVLKINSLSWKRSVNNKEIERFKYMQNYINAKNPSNRFSSIGKLPNKDKTNKIKSKSLSNRFNDIELK